MLDLFILILHDRDPVFLTAMSFEGQQNRDKDGALAIETLLVTVDFH